MEDFHVFTLKYLGPTNTLGPRLKLTSCPFGQSVVLNRDYKFNSFNDQAVDYLRKRGFELTGVGELDENTDLIFSSTFEPLSKTKQS